MTLLVVRGLNITVPGAAMPIVKDLSFDVGIERVALVGASGSGKSLTARALMNLLRVPLQMRAEGLRLEDRDLLAATARDWQSIRGSCMALVLQDPRFSLNPVLRVGRQVEETLKLHCPQLTRQERRAQVRDTLGSLGLDPHVERQYPHQLSGGMGQRVVLAMMLINRPRLLIADEPTSALDAAVRAQVLDLLREAVDARGMGLLLISHDLHEVARHCHRVLVMHRGQLVDECAAQDLPHATHPYTRTLWDCAPSGHTYRTRLPVPDRVDGSGP